MFRKREFVEIFRSMVSTAKYFSDRGNSIHRISDGCFLFTAKVTKVLNQKQTKSASIV